MKKYYDLDNDGKIKSSYARNQPHIEGLKLLKENPFEYGIWDGKKWIEDELKKAKKELAETDNDLIRIIDDIINYIVDGTPLPQDVKDKISTRKVLRDKI